MDIKLQQLEAYGKDLVHQGTSNGNKFEMKWWWFLPCRKVVQMQIQVSSQISDMVI